MEKNKDKIKQKRIMDSISAENRVLDGLKKEKISLTKDVKKLSAEYGDEVSKLSAYKLDTKKVKEGLDKLKRSLQEKEVLLDSIISNISQNEVALVLKKEDLDKLSEAFQEEYEVKSINHDKKVSLLDSEVSKLENKKETVSLDIVSLKADLKNLKDDHKKAVVVSDLDDQGVKDRAEDLKLFLVTKNNSENELKEIKNAVKVANEDLAGVQKQTDQAIIDADAADKKREKAESQKIEMNIIILTIRQRLYILLG